MPDQVTSQLPPGAGRFQDFIWPDPFEYLASGVGAAHRSRTSGGAAMPGVVVVFGAGTSAVAIVKRGVPAFEIFSDVANAGSQRIFYPGFPVTLRTSRSPIDGTVDDCAVYRFVVNMTAFNTALGVNGEMGFQVSQYNGGGGQRIVGDASPGFGINLLDGANVAWIVRGPNGLVSTNITPAGGFDTGAWHSYDIRVFSATANADAFLTLKIDNVPVPLSAVNSSWAAGTNLPPAAVSGSSVGFAASVVSSAQNTNAIGINLCHLIAAPTELMTL